MRKWIIAAALSLFVVVPAFAQECPEGEDCRTGQSGSGGRSQLGSGGRVETTSDELCLTDLCKQGGSGGRSQLGSGGRAAEGVWTLQTIELAGRHFVLGMLELADGTFLWTVR